MEARQLWENAFEKRRESILKDWETFLRFPSIGTDPAHKSDCEACADWLCTRLKQSGFETQNVETAGNPFVYAKREGNPDKPTLLIYGHYDVQPVDPLEDWTAPPFEPQWSKDRLYARGAQDNKGQIFYTICAIESLIAAGKLDHTLILLIEGEEEFGSASLEQVLDTWREEIQADALLVHDTGTVASGDPTLIMGLRGMLQFECVLQGATHDLHSGLHGGIAPNAAQAAATICASLYDATGRVTVPGFYDGVQPPTEQERELATKGDITAESYREQIGTTPDGGIRDLPPYERIGFLPTLEINGIHAGYGGPGSKTIIPAQATIKLTSRIVQGQDPQALIDTVCEHIRKQTPPGIQLEITQAHIGGAGMRFAPDSRFLPTAERALAAVKPGSPIIHRWEGASIPIVARLAEVSGATPLLTGFGHEEDRIHAPNESFSLDQFRNGFLYTCLLLSQL